MKTEFSQSTLPASPVRQVASGRTFTCDDPNRRDVVCGGGVAVFSLILAGLLGASKPAMAQSLTGSIPELDRVAVRIVTDSYQFAVGEIGESLYGDMPRLLRLCLVITSIPASGRARPRPGSGGSGCRVPRG